MTLELGTSPDGFFSWALYGNLTVCWITGRDGTCYSTCMVKRHDSEDMARLVFEWSLCG